MTGAESRLKRLEVVWPPPPAGCPVCAGWGPWRVCDDAGRCDRPERCPGCGRRVRPVTTVVLVGVDVDRL